MTDIHCHILPAVDDGSKNWETTLEMCRLAYSDGIRHVVATPHANGQYDYDRTVHLESISELRSKVPDMEFSLGCDFHVSIENMDDATRFPDRYVINETPYLLIEFSDFQTPAQMTESVNRLHSAGFLTIISHPERNQIIEAYPDLPQLFVDMGAALQITAGSICGDWGRKAKKTCEALLKKGLVSFIASDAHDAKMRKPILSLARKAAEKIVGRTAAEILVSNNPSAVVSSYVSTQ